MTSGNDGLISGYSGLGQPADGADLGAMLSLEVNPSGDICFKLFLRLYISHYKNRTLSCRHTAPSHGSL